MATIKENVDAYYEEIRTLSRLWEGSDGWRSPLGKEPDLETLAADETLELIQDGNRTVLIDKRPLEEVNPTLAGMYESFASDADLAFRDPENISRRRELKGSKS